MKLPALAACGAALFASVIWQAPAVAATQQDKMTTCNAAASAKNLTGDARKSFMSECLKAH
jgi:hypothetical protein